MREETLLLESDPKPSVPFQWFPAIVLLAPAAWLLAFWSLVVRARLATGEWPYPRFVDLSQGEIVMHETIDPKALGTHATFVTFGIIGLIYFVPMVLLFLILGAFLPRLRQPPALVAAFLVASALVVATIIMDPGGFVEWFAD